MLFATLLTIGLLSINRVSAQDERATVRLDRRAVLRVGPTADVDALTRAARIEQPLGTLLQNPQAITPARIEVSAQNLAERIIVYLAGDEQYRCADAAGRCAGLCRLRCRSGNCTGRGARSNPADHQRAGQPPVVVLVRDFEPDLVRFEVRFWTDSRRVDYLATLSTVRRAIIAQFKAAGIALPNPNVRIVTTKN